MDDQQNGLYIHIADVIKGVSFPRSCLWGPGVFYLLFDQNTFTGHSSPKQTETLMMQISVQFAVNPTRSNNRVNSSI